MKRLAGGLVCLLTAVSVSAAEPITLQDIMNKLEGEVTGEVGVDEALIGSSDGYFIGKEDAIKEYDARENLVRFKSLPAYMSFNERVGIIEAVKVNFEILSRLDSSSLDSLLSEERDLKELMLSIEELDSSSDLLRALDTYALISEYAEAISPRNIPLTSNIILTLKNKEGDCSEYSALYYSLMNYYGIDTSFKFGILYVGEERGESHVWISVKAEGKEFDLDPRNFPEPIPLLPRNPERIKGLRVEEYHTGE